MCLILLTGCGKAWVGVTIPEDSEGLCSVVWYPQNREWETENFFLQYTLHKSGQEGEYQVQGQLEFKDAERYYQFSKGYITMVFLEKIPTAG